jgi:hypothetical protein
MFELQILKRLYNIYVWHLKMHFQTERADISIKYWPIDIIIIKRIATLESPYNLVLTLLESLNFNLDSVEISPY